MILLDLTPFYHSRSGGIRRYLLEKVRFLSRVPEIKHLLVIPGKGRKVYFLEKTKVYEIPSIPIPRSGGYRFFFRTSDLSEIIKSEAPDIVELGGWYHGPEKFRLRSWQRVIVFYHSDPFLLSKLGPFLKISEKFLIRYLRKNLNQADLVLVPSHAKEAFLSEIGVSPLVRVPLGVDPQIFNPCRRDPELLRKLKIDEDKIRLIYVGRLSREKNLELLLRVFALLDKRRYHLLIVGDGPKRSLVEQAKKELGSITYLGYIEDRDLLARLYASSHIYVSTSLGETFGLSFVEAQACGCLLISLDMGLETQPFKDFLVRELDAGAFLEAIERASSHLSEELRQKISTEILNSFSWDRTFRRLLTIYSSLEGNKIQGSQFIPQ